MPVETYDQEKSSIYTAPFSVQFLTLTKRSWLTTLRDVALTKARFGQAIVIGLLIGLIYLRIPDNQKSIQNLTGVMFFIMVNQSMGGVFGVLQTFGLELPMFHREYQAGMYTPGSFFLSRTMSEVPFQLFFPCLFVSVTYWMVGFNPDVDRFFTFMFIIVLTSNAAFSLGYVVSTMSPSVQVALALGPVILLPFIIFGGFFINTLSIPAYFSWLEYVSFFKYGFEALAINEFQDKVIGCDPGENCDVTDGNKVIINLGLDINNFWRDIGILLALLIGFRIFSYFFLWMRSKQKHS